MSHVCDAYNAVVGSLDTNTPPSTAFDFDRLLTVETVNTALLHQILSCSTFQRCCFIYFIRVS